MKNTRLKWFDAGHGTTGVELGIISADVFMKYIRFKVYQDFRRQGFDVSTSEELAAERNKCSAITIFRDRVFFGDVCPDPVRKSAASMPSH